MPSLTHDGPVAVLDLGDTENRFHPLGTITATLHAPVLDALRSAAEVPA